MNIDRWYFELNAAVKQRSKTKNKKQKNKKTKKKQETKQ